MPPVRNLRPGYTIWYPNRDKAASKIVKLIVALILVASVVLMLALTIGGWSKFEGMKVVNFVWCVLFLICAYYVLRWKRGTLPIAAGLSILLLMVVIIGGAGLAGTSWFDRNSVGFGGAQSLFGGSGFSNSTLGTLTVILIPVQVLLIVFAMIGFSQGWNIEQEIKKEDLERRRRGSGSGAQRQQQQPAAA